MNLDDRQRLEVTTFEKNEMKMIFDDNISSKTTTIKKFDIDLYNSILYVAIPSRSLPQLGKNPHESNFLRNVSREILIWLENMWLVNKDWFVS